MKKLKALFQELTDNCQASIAESGVSSHRIAYRKALLQDAQEALNVWSEPTSAEQSDFDALYSIWISRNGSRSPSIKYALKWMYGFCAEHIPSKESEVPLTAENMSVSSPESLTRLYDTIVTQLQRAQKASLYETTTKSELIKKFGEYLEGYYCQYGTSLNRQGVRVNVSECAAEDLIDWLIENCPNVFQPTEENPKSPRLL